MREIREPVDPLERARHLVDLDRPEQAMALLAPHLATHPDDGDALVLAARATLDLGRAQEARVLAARAAAARPEDEWPLRLMAYACAALGLTSQAVEAAQAAIRLDPQEWRTHVTLVSVAARAPKHWELALASGRTAVQLAPQNPSTHAALAGIAQRAHELDEAERSWLTVLRLDPGNALALNELGRIRLDRGDRVGAASHFADSAAADPHDRIAAGNVEVAVSITLFHSLRWALLTACAVSVLAVFVRGWPGIVAGWAAAAVIIGSAGQLVRDLRRATRGALGRYLRRLPGRDRLLTAALASLAGGVVALFVAVVVPPGPVRIVGAAVGVAVLLACRLLVGPVLRARR